MCAMNWDNTHDCTVRIVCSIRHTIELKELHETVVSIATCFLEVNRVRCELLCL